MPWLIQLAQTLVRAVHLLSLAFVPQVFSPEPRLPDAIAVRSFLSLLVLAALVGGAIRFRNGLGTRDAKLAAGLWFLAVGSALAGAAFHSGNDAPLARGVPTVGLFVWSALAMTAVAAVRRWLGDAQRKPRVVAAIVVLGLGAMLYVDASPLLASPESMWWDALRHDPTHDRAIAALSQPLLRARKYDDAKKVASRCITLAPQNCACQEVQAEAHLGSRALPDAIAAARIATQRCPTRASTRVVLAEALAMNGQTAAAAEEAQLGIELGGDRARLEYARALAFERSGQYDDARVAVLRAIAAGAGRDAKLLASVLSILDGDLEGAAAWLTPLLVENPSDIDAQYNLALVADRQNDYNKARQGYLAVLRLDPKNMGARYNLALLTWRNEVAEEARHHARKFMDAYPDDPRNAHLATMMGIKR